MTAQVRASHILVKDEAKAQSMRTSILGGASFESFAQVHSLCPSKIKGGDLGFFTRGKMVKAFEDAAFALQIGEISEVVPTRFGFHIIKRTA